MSIELTEITKSKYYSERNGELLADRPLGFIKLMDDERTMFISLNGKHYMGVMQPWQHNEQFMNMKFNEIKTKITAEFTMPEPVMS